MKQRLPVSFLKTIIRYDSDSGEFYWIVTRGARVVAGTKAGTLHKYGYIHIKIFGLIYKGHRLAWAFVTGSHPEHDVEHKDLNKANNRWANLREANDFGNQANTSRRKDNTSGFKSVHYRKDSGKWRARIGVHNKRIALGSFDTPEEAHAAYAAAAKKYFGQFARIS